MNYFNEHDPKAAEWLRVLSARGAIPTGYIDDRDVQAVAPTDLSGYAQCHLFAGIGGWAHALDLAGWPPDKPVWSSSLPCQPFSAAGKQRGTDDERHLWPVFRGLVEQCLPPIIFGEQVSSKLAVGESTYVSPKKSVEHLLDAAGRNTEEESQRSWFATVQADLEDLGYVVAASDLPAAGVGAPHIRQRLYWCAVRREGELPGAGAPGVPEVVEERFGVGGLGIANSSGSFEGREAAETVGHGDSVESAGGVGGVVHPGSERRQQVPGSASGDEAADRGARRDLSEPDCDHESRGTGEGCGLPDPERQRLQRRTGEAVSGKRRASIEPACVSAWDDVVYIPCSDGKARPLPRGVESSPLLLVNGVFVRLATVLPIVAETVAADAIKTYSDPLKIMRVLREAVQKKTIHQWSTRGTCELSKAEILQHLLLGAQATCERAADCRSGPKAGNEADSGEVRMLREWAESLYAPYRLQPPEQRLPQSASVVQELPSILARFVEETVDQGAWTDASVAPLVTGLQGRVAMLRGLGNAIVPQVAAVFVKSVMECMSEA